MIGFLIFFLGLIIGSFLNVCIYRIPRPDMSIHSPHRSFCGECRQPITAIDNIPLLSYFLLCGKCRNCHAKISVMYPAVELATALLFFGLFYHFKGVTLEFLQGAIFVVVLLPIAFIDAQHYIIPNVLIGFGLGGGLVIVALIAYQQGDVDYVLTRLIGVVGGITVMWLIAMAGSAMLRKTAMGGGDIKLMGLNGLFLGAWPELVMVLAFSAIGGALVGTGLVISNRKSRQSPIPYGPFLAIAAFVVLLWGEPLWNTYLQLIGWN